MVNGKNDRDRLCLIVNPRSAGGATGRRIGALKDAAARHFLRWEIRETRHPGHGAALAAAAVEDGFTLICAVGGDGTANEVVNGLIDGDVARGSAAFSVVPAGTGSDLIRTLRVPRDLDDALSTLARAEDRPSDLLAVTCDGDNGPVRRICVNVTGFGLNGDVVSRVNASSKRLGGGITFLSSTLRALASWSPPRVVVRYTERDGAEREWEGELNGGFLANAQYCGGGMWVGRGGSLQDGLVELTIVPKLGAADVARALPRIYEGTIGQVAGVVTAQVRHVSVRALDTTRDIPVDTDGECPGRLPLDVRVLPAVLPVRARWP